MGLLGGVNMCKLNLHFVDAIVAIKCNLLQYNMLGQYPSCVLFSDIGTRARWQEMGGDKRTDALFRGLGSP